MEKDKLSKNLKPSNVFAIAIGSIIGFSCFVLPGNWLRDAGPMGAVVAFVVATVMILFIANSYGYMVKNYPVAGGAVAYAYKGFGRNAAFLCGWLLSLGFLSIIALNAMALPVLVRFVTPTLLTRGYLYTVAGYDVYFLEVLFSVVTIGLFGYLNIVGSDKVGKIQFVMVGLLFLAVILLGTGSLLTSSQAAANLKPLFALDKTKIGAVLSVLAIAPMAFVGFDTIPHAAEEFDFSPSLALKLMFIAIAAGGVMYVTVLLSTASVFSWHTLMTSTPVWATGEAMQSTMGTFGLMILLVGVSMGIMTGINGFYMATSRLLYGMARAKMLPEWLSTIHHKHKTPMNAILFSMVLSMIAPWFGRTAILWVVDMCSAGTAISFAFTCITANMMSKAGAMSSWKHMVGFVFSVGFLVMLLLPASPAVMPREAMIAFGVWALLGGVFYMVRAKEYLSIPKMELDVLIYGEKDVDSNCQCEQCASEVI